MMKMLMMVTVALAVGWVGAVTPVPAEAIDDSELSAAFHVTFGKLPCAASPVTGPFEVTAEPDGRLTVRFLAEETDLAGDFVCSTVTKVKPGERHHLELTYSLQRRRVAVYMDGKFEWENDRLVIPKLKNGKWKIENGKCGGRVEGLKVYPYELESEQLALVSPDGEKTIAEAKREAKDAKKREVFKDVKGPAAYYVVPPYSQEIFLPYDLPRRGTLGGEAFQFAAGDQQVAASVLVFALQAPLTIKGAKVGDLRTADGKVFSAKDVDVKLVKRWYRAGGAWLTYHNDPRQRNLTPDLLMYDDAAIKVDELKKRNYIRLDYPEGTRYVDVSIPTKEAPGWNDRVPFHDATELQPLTISEWGRNQQFLVTFDVKKGQAPGLYRGELELVGAVKVPLALQVLPIDLPEQGSPKHNLSKSYISLNNSFPSPMGATLEKRREIALKTMKEVRAHRLMHTECLWETPTHAELARKAGFSEPDRIFTDFTGSIPDWRTLYPKERLATLTLADKAEAEKVILRGLLPVLAQRKDTFAKRPEDYILFYSESMGYCRLVKAQEGQAEIARKAGFSVFSHIMNDDVNRIGVDVMDMTATTTVEKKYAEQWNAAGGELINYANPFPSGENPEFYRRRVGVLMYQCDFSGEMLHECFRRLWPFHEWFTDGETGTYRNFEMCYPTHDGFIWKLAYDGMREALNDVRYFTALKQRAVKWQYAADEALRREAKRQLLWLELLDENTVDLDMLRAAVADRIMILDKLSAAK